MADGARHHETAQSPVLTFLQRLHVAAGERDSNSVNRHFGLHGRLSGIFKCLLSHRRKNKQRTVSRGPLLHNRHPDPFPGPRRGGSPLPGSALPVPRKLEPRRRPRPRGAVPHLTMAEARLPDRLVPQQERTAVSQDGATLTELRDTYHQVSEREVQRALGAYIARSHPGPS